MRYIGVDVARDKLDVSGSRGKSFKVANSPLGIQQLLDWLAAQGELGDSHVVLEATSTYHQHLVVALAKAQVPYSVVNPARTKAYAVSRGVRAKTDKVDARLLACFGEERQPEPSPPPDEDQERLKALRRHADWLRDQVEEVESRIEAAEHSPWTPPFVRESLRRTLREREEELRRLERELQTHVERHARWSGQVTLLESIPGIGWKTAVLLVSELPPVDRCTDGRQWVAFSGLNPAPWESGKSRRASGMSRMGAPAIRGGLFMPALTAMRCNTLVRDLNHRLKARGKCGKARAVAAMAKLLRLAFGVLRTQTPFDPAHATRTVSETSASPAPSLAPNGQGRQGPQSARMPAGQALTPLAPLPA